MLEEVGFEIKDIVKRLSGAPWLKLMNRLLGSQLADFLVRQYIVVGIKR
jgi:hypothetical protein